jgi:hypothetical protein
VVITLWPPVASSPLSLIGVCPISHLPLFNHRGTSCPTTDQPLAALTFATHLQPPEQYSFHRPSSYHRRKWRRERPRPTQWARETGCPTSSKSCRAAQQPRSTSFPSTYTCAMCSGAWTIWTSGKPRTCHARHARCAHGLARLNCSEKDAD